MGAATGLHLPDHRRAQLAPDGYSPDTGLVYIPAQDVPWVYQTEADFSPSQGLLEYRYRLTRRGNAG